MRRRAYSARARWTAPSSRRRQSARGGLVIDSSTSAQTLLRCHGVRVRFGGIAALDGVSFDVSRRQIVGVIGPNGAGKTTLFNCISRLYPVDAGDILFDGQSLLSLPPHRVARLGIARTFQNVALFDRLTVIENVMLGAHGRTSGNLLVQALRLPPVASRERANAEHAAGLLALLDLEGAAHEPVFTLPFGTRKRVELARALAAKPELLLLDEPASGLNHLEVEELRDLIVSLSRRLGLAVLIVEHHVSLVMSISDKVLALDFGRAIAHGTPSEVRHHPDVVRAYLGGAS